MKVFLRFDVLYVVLRDWMTDAGRTLLADGHQDLVDRMRHHLHGRVTDSARSAIEQATGRTVVTAHSRIEFDRKIAILEFTLSKFTLSTGP